jgi:8-oxo-dGTP pyrophosphatase MutT (NUDIX family)
MSSIRYLDHIDFVVEQRSWPFAEERRADIDAHFLKATALEPSYWNGRVLLMHRYDFDDRTFRGAYLETDYASLLAWRDWGWPDMSMRNCYAQAALRGSDGGFVLGVMSAKTANAGQVYFPSGTPDREDVVGGRVNMDMSARRELKEETGLDASDFDIAAGWYAVECAPRIALMKVMQAREPATAVRDRILRFIASEAEPELEDVLIMHGPADIHPRTQDYVRVFLDHIWRG